MKLAVLTTGRQDRGILWSIIQLLRPTIIAWSNPGGNVVDQLALATQAIGQQLEEERPDALMLVGDRYETLAAALLATVLKIPIVHLHGGESTEGAFDDQIRWAITRMAHLHLVSSLEHSEKLVSVGEAPETVFVVGAPGTDNAFRHDLLSISELEARLKIRLRPPVHVYIVHPETLSTVDVVSQAIECKREQVLLQPTTIALMPNHDPGSVEVRQRMKDEFPISIEALTELEYWSLLRHTDLLVGNSSSLVIEAPALNIKVRLLGDRQKGRTPPMKADGKVAERVRDVLASWSPPKPPRKPPPQPA